MTLNEFLQPLTSTNAQLVLTDLQTGDELASMKAAGHSSLDTAIEGSEVKRWSVVSGATPTIRVVVAYSEEPEPTTTTEE